GRGTGRRAAIFRAEAQRLMNECRTAVPVWIMPLSRAVETFDPRTTRFDVVIIDEASQCDVMGLLAFFIADKVLVVGDDEQVSPSAVGQKVDVIHQLIEQHLDGIPNRKLYDGQMSVYDLAQSSFTRNLRLVEHFRCVPDIIEFSNQLSYQGEIKPLRDASSVELTPHVIEHVVASGYEERKKNRPEAYEIVVPRRWSGRGGRSPSVANTAPASCAVASWSRFSEVAGQRARTSASASSWSSPMKARWQRPRGLAAKRASP